MTSNSRKINMTGLAGFPATARSITWDDVSSFPIYLWPTGRYLVCPKMAAALLAMNQHNRIISKSHVDTLTNQMKLGEWAFQGSSLVLFINGILGDGQHRLEGVVKSGVTIETMIVTSIDPRKFTKIDTLQRLRDKSTALEHFPGVTYPGPTGYAASWVWNYAMGTPILSGSNRLLAANNERIYVTAEHHRGLIDLTNEVCHLKGIKSVFPPALIAVGYLASLVNPAKANEFMSGMITGAMLGINDPRLRMREILANSLRRNQNANSRRIGVTSTMSSLEKFNSMILAWNAFYEGKTPGASKLTWLTSNGETPSVYPSIRGLDRSTIFPPGILEGLTDATTNMSEPVDMENTDDLIAA